MVFNNDCCGYNVKLIKRGKNYQLKTYLHTVNVGYKVKSREVNKSSIARTDKEIERCLNNSMKRTKNMIYDYAMSNNWEWFVTFTFNPRIIDNTDYDSCALALSKWLANVRQFKCSDMIYLVVPELHSDKRKYHFHVLMSNVSGLLFVDSGRMHCNKTVYNIYDWHFGFSTAEAVDNDSVSQSKTCGYMLKYITKDLVNLTKGKRRYWVSRSTISKAQSECFLLQSDDVNVIRHKAIMQSNYVKTLEIPVSYNRVEIIDFNAI